MQHIYKPVNMNIEFADPALEELFCSGKTKHKKYSKLQPSVIKQYVKTINLIRPAQRIEDLYKIKSLNYEKKRNLGGQEAVSINMQYRLHFTSFEDKETLLISNIIFEEISKHYGD